MENSAKSPCWQQQQIAKQNAWLDSIKSGKPVSYAAPCETDKPKTS